jgi:uncharacterized protein YdaU (DUF1376 family)
MRDPQNPKSPAFQWYPNDFMGDVNVQLMDWTQRGIYVWLIGLCWLQKSIPSDIGSLAKITNTSIGYWEENGSNILRCFNVSKSGQLIHPRVEREREKQRAYKEKKQIAGEIGAKSRWSKSSNSNKIHASAILLPLANDSSSSSSSSSISIKEKNTADKLPTENGILKEFIEQEYLSKRGIPMISDGSDWSSFFKLVARCNGRITIEQVKLAWTCYLNSPDKFDIKQGHPLRYFSTNINGFLVTNKNHENQNNLFKMINGAMNGH